MPYLCLGPSATGMSLKSYMDVLAACPRQRYGISPPMNIGPPMDSEPQRSQKLQAKPSERGSNMLNFSSDAIAQLTLWLLGAFSIATWTLILIKAVQHTHIARHNRRFSKVFWSAADLQAAA